MGWLFWLTTKLRRTIHSLDIEISKSRQREKRADVQLPDRNADDIQSLEQVVHRLVRRIERLEDIGTRPTWKPPSDASQPKEALGPQPPNERPVDRAFESRQGISECSRIEDTKREVLQAYNSLAAAFEPDRRDEFVGRFHPEVFSYQNGSFHNDPEGNLWVIRLGTEGSHLIMPSGKVARDWDKLYRKLQGMTAKNEFGELFDFTEGGYLKLELPALASERFGKLEFTSKGHLAGI